MRVMISIKYKSQEEVAEEKRIREERSKLIKIAKKSFGFFDCVIPSFDNFVAIKRFYIGERTHWINVRTRTIDLDNRGYEDRTIAFAEKLKEAGLGDYQINAEYPDPLKDFN